jgi:hypothetical protein
MTKPLDAYDLCDWATDAKGCWALAIAELRKAGVVAGKFQPINDQEREWLK